MAFLRAVVIRAALKFPIPTATVITAAEAACALGSSLVVCAEEVRAKRRGLRPLQELLVVPGLETLLAGWIADRSLLLGRRDGAATNAALHVAKRAAQLSHQWGGCALAG